MERLPFGKLTSHDFYITVIEALLFPERTEKFAVICTFEELAACHSKANRQKPIERDRTLYRQRHKIENMFGRLKDWRRIHTRCGPYELTRSCQLANRS